MAKALERMAPGHVYIPRLGTGIEWKPEQVVLWEQGQVTATAPHQTETPWDFWWGLHFASCFPQVTHWWFRSAWTQWVKISPMQPAPLEDSTIWGWIQFIDDEEEPQPWSITAGAPIVVSTPYPPNEVQSGNFPLRIALARMVLAVVEDTMTPDTWNLVTSLVQRDQLEQTFPPTIEAFMTSFGNWYLPHGEGPLQIPVREAWCRWMGLEPALATNA